MIEFFYDEIANDFQMLSLHGEHFLSVSAPGRMQSAAESLRKLKNAPVGSWRVDENTPIVTMESLGECEIGGNNNWNLVGEIFFQWDIERTSGGRKARFKIRNASTRVRIKEYIVDRATIGDDVLAEWRFEIGSYDHPGCLVHTQAEWHVPNLRGTGKFEIPRWPSIVLTPSECVDFLLGELFQERWPAFSAQNVVAKDWKASHRGRMKKLLESQIDVIIKAEPKPRSPWQALKSWKPEDLVLYK